MVILKVKFSSILLVGLCSTSNKEGISGILHLLGLDDLHRPKHNMRCFSALLIGLCSTNNKEGMSGILHSLELAYSN